MQPTAVASPRKMQSGGTHTHHITHKEGTIMIGMYKIVRKAKLEDYEAQIKLLRLAMEAAEERAYAAKDKEEATAELLEMARDTCNAEVVKAQELREQVLDQQKTIKAQKKDIDRLLGETMQLTLEVEALRQENAALRKIVEADSTEITSEED